MAKKKNQKNTKGKSERKDTTSSNEPWISMRTALIIMGVVSAGLAIFVAWTAIQTQGLLMGIVWGLIFGAANWVVFLIAFLFFRWSRGGGNT